MKRSISWHKQCLANLESTFRREQEQFERAKAELSRLSGRVELYSTQINTAVREGKDGFDPERYLKGRK